MLNKENCTTHVWNKSGSYGRCVTIGFKFFHNGIIYTLFSHIFILCILFDSFVFIFEAYITSWKNIYTWLEDYAEVTEIFWWSSFHFYEMSRTVLMMGKESLTLKILIAANAVWDRFSTFHSFLVRRRCDMIKVSICAVTDNVSKWLDLFEKRTV